MPVVLCSIHEMYTCIACLTPLSPPPIGLHSLGEDRQIGQIAEKRSGQDGVICRI